MKNRHYNHHTDNIIYALVNGLRNNVRLRIQSITGLKGEWEDMIHRGNEGKGLIYTTARHRWIGTDDDYAFVIGEKKMKKQVCILSLLRFIFLVDFYLISLKI